jgi:hypothetical protein
MAESHSTCPACSTPWAGRWIKGLCLKCYGRSWKSANRDKARAHVRDSRLRRIDAVRARERAIYAADPEKFRAKRRRYFHANKAKERQAILAWRAKNPDYFRDYMAHYRVENAEKVKAKERAYAAKFPERIRAKTRKRRALKLQNGCVPYRDVDIFDRDGWICQLCRQPVDASLRWPNKWMATIDHIVQIAHGGPDTPDNVQLAHLSCNSRKQARRA